MIKRRHHVKAHLFAVHRALTSPRLPGWVAQDNAPTPTLRQGRSCPTRPFPLQLSKQSVRLLRQKPQGARGTTPTPYLVTPPGSPQGSCGNRTPMKRFGLGNQSQGSTNRSCFTRTFEDQFQWKERNFSSVIDRKKRRHSWTRKSCVKSLPYGIDMAALGLETAGSSFLGTRTLN